MRIRHVQLTPQPFNKDARFAGQVVDGAICSSTRTSWRLKASRWSLSTNYLWLLLCSLSFFIVFTRATATPVPNKHATDLSQDSPDVATELEQTQWYIVLTSIPVKDKVMPLRLLAMELLRRGHRVSFALPAHCWKWVEDVPRMKFIALDHPYKPPRSSYGEQELLEGDPYESYMQSLNYYAAYHPTMYEPLKLVLRMERPDLVVLDRHTFAAYDVCHALGIPYIVHSSSMLLDVDNPPAHVPPPFSNISMHTTSAFDRCTFWYRRLRYRLLFFRLMIQWHTTGVDPLYSEGRLHNHQAMLVQSAFGLEHARPMSPHVQFVGSYHPTQVSSRKVDATFEEWLVGTNPQAIIFIQFSTDLSITSHFVMAIMSALETLNAHLVWQISLKEEAAFDLGSRARETLYFLGHDVDLYTLWKNPHLSMVITGGEASVTMDALVAGVPVLGLPFTAEQLEVVNAVVREGAGSKLDASTATPEEIRDATLKLVTNEVPFAHAKRLGAILKSAGGTSKAADVIKSVLEMHKSADFVSPVKSNQPLYKSYLMDVYFVYGAIMCCSLVMLRAFFTMMVALLQPLPPLPMGEEVEHANKKE